MAEPHIPARIRSAFSAWDLIVAADWTIERWRRPILDEIEALHGHNLHTCQKLTTNTEALFSYAQSRGIHSLDDFNYDTVPDWVASSGWDKHRKDYYDPATTTQSNRRWAALVALTAARLLGAPVDPKALVRGAVIAHDAGRKTKLLTPDQMRKIQVHADPGALPSRRSVIAALLACGARPDECASVTAAAVDLAAGTVSLGADVSARVNALTGWPRKAIARRLAFSPPASAEERLCVRPTTTLEGAKRSIRAQLTQLMSQAGLRGIEGISGMSIRFTAARLVFEKRGIEAAAVFLGTGSLDTAAAAVGHEWRTR